MAIGLFNTLESIAIPCSVNAKGLAPPNICFEGITSCDTIKLSKSVNSYQTSSDDVLIRGKVLSGNFRF